MIPTPGPFGWVDAAARPRLFLVLSVLLGVLSIALAALGAPLVTAAAPWGIVSYEFAGTAEGAGRVLASWSPAAREHAMLTLGLDFLYLLVYPAWLSLACVFLAGNGFQPGPGIALAWAVLAAGALDAVENLALIRLLTAGPGDAAAGLAWACAGVKFALVLSAAAYVLAGAVGFGWRRLRSA